MLLTIFFFLSLALNLCFSEIQSTTTTTYVIHMDKPKMEALEVSIRSLGSSHTWYEELIESVRISTSNDDGYQPNPILLYVYQHTIFGISARLTGQQLQTLQTMDGYLHAIEGKLLNLLTTHSPQFLGLQEGQGLWSRENLASDVIIGVIDTGVWPEHTSFHDGNLLAVPSRWKGKCKNYTGFNASSCNKKLIGAEVFYKGYEEGMIKEKKNDTSEYRSPRDSNGHGTHTASTAGGNFVSNVSIFGMANGTAAGMRPTARIAAYKVCFKYGCAGPDILAAIDRAVHDGVNVLSMSIGSISPLPYFDDIIAIGAFHAVQKGVIVSFSAGNDGPDSYTVINAAPWMMTVAASSTDRDFLADVYLGNGTKLLGSSLSSQKPINNASLVYNQTKGPNLCLNGSLSPSLVTGKVVICDRGISTRVSKGEEVKRAGGVAMILANTQENGNEVNADPHLIPTVALGVSEANPIREYAKSYKNPTVSIQFKGTVYHNRAPTMTSFSSRGPSKFDPNILKPDITAPGLNILAAFPPNISPTGLDSDKRRVLFNIMSGTSMSAPHVSGIIALIKSVHKDWSPAAIKSALMTTAYVLDSDNSPISDMIDGNSPATPFALGSGHVDANKASDPGLIYDISTQDYLNYLCSLKYNPKQIQIFSGKNDTCSAASRFNPGDLNYPSFSVIFGAKSRCKKFATTHKRTVTNVGSSEVVTYRFQVSEPEGVSITVNPSVLKFTKNRNKSSYNVTFKANWAMRPKPSNFSFGDIKWLSEDGKYSVRSPVAVIWN